MKKTLSMLFVFAFLTAPLFGVASADETHPDCEADQPGLGWESVPEDDYQRTCEGEHWDGEDHYTMGDQNTNGGGAVPCTGASTGGSYTAVSVLQCADPKDNPDIKGVRASTGDGNDGQYAYAMISIALVGSAAVHAEGTMAAVYLQDDSSFELLANAVSALRITRGEAGSDDCTHAEYTDAAGWESGQHNPDDENPSACTRDNTAITVVLLP